MQKETIITYLIDHKQEFQKKYEIEKIGLFGSYARDEAHEGSDIDIYLVPIAPAWEYIRE